MKIDFSFEDDEDDVCMCRACRRAMEEEACDRVHTCEMLPALALSDAIAHGIKPPAGWVLDRPTGFYIPPTLHFDGGCA